MEDKQVQWTATLVKEILPHVRVRFADGTTQDAMVLGRRCQFPIVSVKVHGSWLNREVTWEDIARALNKHKELSI